jgi:hypothetical protein
LTSREPFSFSRRTLLHGVTKVSVFPSVTNLHILPHAESGDRSSMSDSNCKIPVHVTCCCKQRCFTTPSPRPAICTTVTLPSFSRLGVLPYSVTQGHCYRKGHMAVSYDDITGSLGLTGPGPVREGGVSGQMLGFAGSEKSAFVHQRQLANCCSSVSRLSV